MRSHQNIPWAERRSIPVTWLLDAKLNPDYSELYTADEHSCDTSGNQHRRTVCTKLSGLLKSPWLCPWLLTPDRGSASCRGPPQHQIRSRHPVTAVTITRPDPSFPSLLLQQQFSSNLVMESRSKTLIKNNKQNRHYLSCATLP